MWGSYYNRSHSCWGYACCHAILKNAYCTGAAGKEANDKANSTSMDPNQQRQMLENRSNLINKSITQQQNLTKRSDLYGESTIAADTEINEEKLKAAMKREEEFYKDAIQQAQGSNSSNNTTTDNKSTGYNSMKTIDVGLEDMEAYRLKRQRKDDPMFNLLNNEELLPK